MTNPTVPPGWQLVPVAATPDHMEDAYDTLKHSSLPDEMPWPDAWREWWSAMLAAAPEPPTCNGWQPIETAPRDGKFLVAQYAPTSWAYHVTTVHIPEGDYEHYREGRLRYARAWRPLPAPPTEPTL